MVGIFCK